MGNKRGKQLGMITISYDPFLVATAKTGMMEAGSYYSRAVNCARLSPIIPVNGCSPVAFIFLFTESHA